MSLRLASRQSLYICRSCSRDLTKIKRRRFGTNSITSNPEEIYDIVTVGGGPVGLALLTALKSSPITSHLKCALIEIQSLPKQKSWDLSPDLYSNRASSVTPTNQTFLESIGAWSHLDLRRVQPYDEMQVWDAGNDAAIQFDWKAESIKYNSPLRTVATMCENSNLSRALLRRLEELNAEGSLFSATSVERIENGLDDPEALDLSSWPILSLKSSSTANDQASSQRIAARLLIGADGINSPVRTFAGINTNGWDYNRHGVVATLKLEPSPHHPYPSNSDSQNFDSALEDFLAEDNENSSTKPSNSDQLQNITPSNRATAYQRFLPSLGGPIAILPLPNNHASLVWSTTPQVAQTLKSLSPSAFVATVNAALTLDPVDIEYMLSLPTTANPSTDPSASTSESTTSPTQHENELTWRLQHTSPPSPSRPPPKILHVQPNTVASFPLRLRNSATYTAPHIALAGDAAHTIHPLAGQGLNLGLGDAECLARTIAYSVEHGMDIGDVGALEAYGRERYGRAVEMGSGVDVLNSLYQLGSDGGVLGGVIGRMRGLGMAVLGALPGVKEGIMRRAE